MDIKKLVRLRRQAEDAVVDMAAGDLKIKAFEVILNQLLTDVSTTPEADGPGPAEKPKTKHRMGAAARSTAGRVLVLQDEGFFDTQRSIGQIKEELGAHGWHYPLTTLSGRLQGLVQTRHLRRSRVKQGNKKVWKYSNP